jgi:hypothetical protein
MKRNIERRVNDLEEKAASRPALNEKEQEWDELYRCKFDNEHDRRLAIVLNDKRIDQEARTAEFFELISGKSDEELDEWIVRVVGQFPPPKITRTREEILREAAEYGITDEELYGDE